MAESILKKSEFHKKNTEDSSTSEILVLTSRDRQILGAFIVPERPIVPHANLEAGFLVTLAKPHPVLPVAIRDRTLRSVAN